MPIEMFYRGSISTERFLTVLFAQSLGGYSAYRIANTLWYYTVNYSADHAHFYRDLPCSIQYKVPFMYVIAYEVFGCFMIRLLITKVPENYKRFIVPVIFGSFLSFALTYVGIPALNPVTTSSRLLNCPGLDIQWFLIVYWCAPVCGWLLAAALDKNRKLKAGGKNKKEKSKRFRLRSTEFFYLIL
ncbi:hypothetical protein M3Y94_00188300 [Aphelenchoides besseyi]|nr:hypothetical protein M3Y94_00188300 [Aphelenchoides besseyi]